MQGFADHKSALTERPAEPCGLAAAIGARRATRSAKSLKFVLDGWVESNIEWQASLIESQFGIAALKRGEFKPR
jgi:hypothetical protein